MSDIAELRQMIADGDVGDAYFETLVFFEDERAGFACNQCARDVSETPCPDHAPLAVPGLHQAECEADPPHVVYGLDGDHCGYGMPCPLCMVAEYVERERQARWCRHWGWRRWPVTAWVLGWAYRLGVVSGYGISYGEGHDGCHKLGSWSGSRPYVLGVRRETWRCWRRGHRRGEEVGFGFCGKCVPWPCCGAERVDHAPGCVEEYPASRAVEAVSA